jgi:hypothetical protein
MKKFSEANCYTQNWRRKFNEVIIALENAVRTTKIKRICGVEGEAEGKKVETLVVGDVTFG